MAFGLDTTLADTGQPPWVNSLLPSVAQRGEVFHLHLRGRGFQEGKTRKKDAISLLWVTTSPKCTTPCI